MRVVDAVAGEGVKVSGNDRSVYKDAVTGPWDARRRILAVHGAEPFCVAGDGGIDGQHGGRDGRAWRHTVPVVFVKTVNGVSDLQSEN